MAFTAVVAGIVVGYSLLRGSTPANSFKKKVSDRFSPSFSRLLAIMCPDFLYHDEKCEALILEN